MKKPDKHLVFFDVETYRNYFLLVMRLRTRTGEHRSLRYELYNDLAYLDGAPVPHGREGLGKVVGTIKTCRMVSFNGLNYDMWILGAALAGYPNAKLKKLSDTIILKGIPAWKINDHFPDIKLPKADHIDLIGVTPLMASLKAYGCRIHSPKLQDLPVEPSAKITDDLREELLTYCDNDVEVTERIYDEMLPDIELREAMSRTYNADFRSKSGPQIAEGVIRELMRREGEPVSKREGDIAPFSYQVPPFIEFESPELQELLEDVRSATFEVEVTGSGRDKKQKVGLPPSLDNRVVEFEGAKYKMGIGGLHSQESRQAIEAGEDEQLGELDVASMYPSIIIGQRLCPPHLSDKFVGVYTSIFDERMAAKRSGDKVVSDSLKLVLNSSFGKFGNQYSFLYSPELLIQTTITGQLALLMLIERVSKLGRVVSANTDGVVLLYESALEADVRAVARQWTADTTYLLEWTPYRALYSDSVNSYIAVKLDGGTKRKGAYADGSIAKGYASPVCIDAAAAYLEHGTPVEQTIRAETDVCRFMTMRGVTGGAIWRGQELGKVVRWYVSTEGEEITYKKNGNKVASSDGAVPLMDLPDSLPEDIDYDWYITKAQKMLVLLGKNSSPKKAAKKKASKKTGKKKQVRKDWPYDTWVTPPRG